MHTLRQRTGGPLSGSGRYYLLVIAGTTRWWYIPPKKQQVVADLSNRVAALLSVILHFLKTNSSVSSIAEVSSNVVPPRATP